jgi:hypothetical protein
LAPLGGTGDQTTAIVRPSSVFAVVGVEMANFDRTAWKKIWAWIKAIGDAIAPIRHISWLIVLISAVITMIYSIHEWFFPLLAFGAVGAQIVFAIFHVLWLHSLKHVPKECNPTALANQTQVRFGSIAASGLGTIATPKPIGNIATLSEEETVLLGEWQAKSEQDPDVLNLWDFSWPNTVIETRKDGTLHKGKWTIQPGHVHIAWESGLWDNLNRPINQTHLRGDNHTGHHNCVIADKINTSEAA